MFQFIVPLIHKSAPTSKGSCSRRLGAVQGSVFCAITLAGLSCRSADSYAAEADQEVYALIEQRCEAIVDGSTSFTLDPPEDSLRQQILRGEWDESRLMTLVECLEIAAENSREVQSQRESLYRSALDLTLERWRYSWRPFARADGTVSGVGDDPLDADASASTGLSTLLGSGASIVASLGANMFRIVSSGAPWTESADLSLSITQPLMRGAGLAIATEPLTQSERNLVYAVRDYERFRRTYAVDVARRVYGLLQTIDELTNEERNYADLVRLRERNEAMAAAGRLSDIQADQASQDELSSENRIINLQANLARQEDQFNLFLGLPVGVTLRLDPAEFAGLLEGDSSLDAMDAELASRYALSHRLDHMTVVDRVEDAERRILLAEDALRIGVDLGLNGTAGTPGGTGELDAIRFQDAAWSVSLALDLPIDRVSERNSLRSARISLAAARRSLEQAEDAMVAEIRDVFRDVRDTQQSTIIQRGAVALAKRRVESSQLNLAAGRAETRDLLDAQAAMVRAENNVTASLIAYNLARFNLYLQLEALSVDENGIHVAQDSIQSLLNLDQGSQP